MTPIFLDWLLGLILSGDIHPFYVTPEWRKLSRDVLRDDHWDCQICKASGKRVPAVLVHHVKHVKKFPDLALSRYYADENGHRKRNLISVCRGCHETVCHPERMRKQTSGPAGFVSAERWD